MLLTVCQQVTLAVSQPCASVEGDLNLPVKAARSGMCGIKEEYLLRTVLGATDFAK